MLRAIVLLAVLLAGTPLDIPHAAVLDTLTRFNEFHCTPAELQAAAAGATIRTLGRVAGDDVVVTEIHAPCTCHIDDCAILALRLTPGKPRVLLNTSGAVSTRPDATLPVIAVRANAGAPVNDEIAYAFRDGRYVDVGHSRVRRDTGARKPDTIPVRFAPGASSAQLHGSASVLWYDAYTFGAEKGQQALIDGVRSPADVRVGLALGDQIFEGFRTGEPFTLPATGTYQLQVAIDKDQVIPYTLTLAIGNHLRAPQQSGSRSRAAAAALPAKPDAALQRWAQSIPAVHCFPSVFSMWTDSKGGVEVPLTRITAQQFWRLYSRPDPRDATTVIAGGGERDSYGLGRVASTGAAVFDKGGPDEDSYVAVLADTPGPPRRLAALRRVERLGGGLGLGSTRATVEAALGVARTQAACGLNAVHYGPRPQPASEADVWFFYRGGVVVGFVLWNAV